MNAPLGWRDNLTIPSLVLRSTVALISYLMDGGKEALEKFAREAVALYGRDAPKLLLHRAEIAVEYGDKVSAKQWRELAGIACPDHPPPR
jgi:hypothetical protein